MLEIVNVLKKNRFEIIIILYLLLKPFYVLPSSVQLADILLLISGIIIHNAEYKYSIPKVVELAYRWFLIFVLWTCVINLIWYLYLNNQSNKYGVGELIKGSTFLVFNGITIYIVLTLYRILGPRLYNTFVYGAAISVAVQVIMSFVLYDESLNRQVIGFSNPNQLGYYAIIMLTIAIIWGSHLKMWQLYLFILGTLYLNFLSLSKASIIAGILMLMVGLVYRYDNKGFFNRKMKILIILTGCLGVFAIMLYSAIGGEIALLRQMVDRIASMVTEMDSDLGSGRGYDRIFEMSGNLLWGMGEGVNERFVTMPGKEIHSTYMAIWVSYGVVGFFLWIISLIKFMFVRGKRGWVLLCCSGVALYWITHNGIRNTIFWMCLVLLSIYIREEGDIQKKLCKR